MDFDIINNAGHYDVYIEGVFYCSADTHPEAAEEVENYFKKLRNESEVMR